MCKYGLIHIYPNHILNGGLWSNNSALNKHEYFKNHLLDKNKNLFDEILEFHNEYTTISNYIIFTTKYGICRMKPSSMLTTGVLPSIKCATDKLEYFKAKLKYNNLECFNKIKYFTSEYKDARSYLYFKTIHGECRMTPDSMMKTLPTFESAINKTEYLISEAMEVHGEKYDYSLFEYAGDSHIKYPIICKEHGLFYQDFASHKQGFGCKKCSNKSKDGFFTIQRAEKNKDDYVKIFSSVYVLRFSLGKESFYKIGISKNVEDRLKQLNFKNDYVIAIKYLLETNLYNAVKMENKLHTLNRYLSYEPNIKFNGYTECFSDLSSHVLDILNKEGWNEYNI